MTLSSNSALPAAIARPGYARERIKPRIVHLGFGAFFRAHQAVYAEQLANEHAGDWGYCVISMHNGQQKSPICGNRICCIQWPKWTATAGAAARSA